MATVLSSSINKTAPRRFGRAHVLSIVLFGATVAALGLWSVALRAPALSFGPPEATHFSQPTAAAGEEIGLCYDALTWNRLCPAELVTGFDPAPGLRLANGRLATRVDNLVHKVATPLVTGPKAPKCRAFTVPRLPERLVPGAWTLTGHLSAACAPLGDWAPVITPLPPVKLTIVKGAG